MKTTLADQIKEVRHQLDEFERWHWTLAGFGCGVAEASVRLCGAMETLDAMLRGPEPFGGGSMGCYELPLRKPTKAPAPKWRRRRRRAA